MHSFMHQDPDLWHEFEKIVARRLSVSPYPPLICETLKTHFFGFEVTEVRIFHSFIPVGLVS